MMPDPIRSFRRTWTVPIVLAVIVLSGLLAALLDAGLPWKTVSWIALALPVAVILWFAWLRPAFSTRAPRHTGKPS